MRYKDRTGKEVCANGQQDVFLQKMYGTALGRKLLSVLVQPVVSKIAGRFMDSGLSAVLVSPFVQKNHIDLSQYEKKEFTSYNDFGYTESLLSHGAVTVCRGGRGVYSTV